MRLIKYRIREKSWLAKLAAMKLRSDNVAMVIGRTIHLHGVDKDTFRQNHRWLRHEQEHLRQYADNGTILFLIKYLIESARKGYYHNKYEAEARMAEEEWWLSD